MRLIWRVGEREMGRVQRPLVGGLRLRLAQRRAVGLEHVRVVGQEDVREHELRSWRGRDAVQLAQLEQGALAMPVEERQLGRRPAEHPVDRRHHRGVAEDRLELARDAEHEVLVRERDRPRRSEPGAQLVVAVALRLEELADRVVLEHRLRGRAVARDAADRLRELVQVAHVERRGEREVGGPVVGVAVGGHLEASPAQPAVQVVVRDVEPAVDRLRRPVAVEDQEVDVARRARGRVGEDRGREGDRRPPGATQLVGHDRGPGEHDQDDREHVQPRRHRRERAAGPDRVHQGRHEHQAPQRELRAVVEAAGGEAARHVPVGEERHHGRRRDDRPPPPVAQDHRGHGPQHPGDRDRASQRRRRIDREHEREVGRVQEQHRVRREQERVEGDSGQQGHRAQPGRLIRW